MEGTGWDGMGDRQRTPKTKNQPTTIEGRKESINQSINLNPLFYVSFNKGVRVRVRVLVRVRIRVRVRVRVRIRVKVRVTLSHLSDHHSLRLLEGLQGQLHVAYRERERERERGREGEGGRRIGRGGGGGVIAKKNTVIFFGFFGFLEG
jgi:hypothetical protein